MKDTWCYLSSVSEIFCSYQTPSTSCQLPFIYDQANTTKLSEGFLGGGDPPFPRSIGDFSKQSDFSLASVDFCQYPFKSDQTKNVIELSQRTRIISSSESKFQIIR